MSIIKRITYMEHDTSLKINELTLLSLLLAIWCGLLTGWLFWATPQLPTRYINQDEERGSLLELDKRYENRFPVPTLNKGNGRLWL